ncbi:MAG: OmpA family protein [Flavobacteriales bacterium]
MIGFKKFISICFICVVQVLSAQDSSNYELTRLKLNLDQKDVILTSLLPDGGITLTPTLEDYISSWTLDEADSQFPTTLKAQAPDFNSAENSLLNLDISEHAEIGTVCFNSSDSALVFSAISGGKSSIYYQKKGTKPEVILSGSPDAQYFHPFLSEDGSQLFYTSNEGNFKDNYDLFYINLEGGKWTAPARLNDIINTQENELFPTWYDDTLYYSVKAAESQILNLYSSAKLDQYKSRTLLRSPFNSSSDDFLLHKKSNTLFYVTSNRTGQRDFPFLIKKTIPVNEEMVVMGYLACSGNRISNIPITLKNALGAFIDNDTTNSIGNFMLTSSKQIKSYKLKLEKNDPRIKDCATLYLTDKDGNVIQKITMNDEGEFIFEMLSPDDINALNLKPLEDESLLQIELNGQIFENEPGDVGAGEPVYIVSETGEAKALTYTSTEGKFTFPDLAPEAEYRLKLDNSLKNFSINIIKDFQIIPIPVLNNEATYERISKENALELVDETGRSITVKKNEFFSIQNILYEFDSDQLASESEEVLKRLAQFIFNNAGIDIELTSHTDSRGGEDYNLMLSQKRAASAIDFLKTLGVPENQMTGYGVGEKDLLNGCVDGVNCTEKEHALNRRTEIRILSK